MEGKRALALLEWVGGGCKGWKGPVLVCNWGERRVETRGRECRGEGWRAKEPRHCWGWVWRCRGCQ